MKPWFSFLLVICLGCSQQKANKIEQLQQDIRTNNYLIKVYKDAVENRRRWGDTMAAKECIQLIEELKASNKIKSDSLLILQK